MGIVVDVDAAGGAAACVEEDDVGCSAPERSDHEYC